MSGSASRSGREGPRFDPWHSDQSIQKGDIECNTRFSIGLTAIRRVKVSTKQNSVRARAGKRCRWRRSAGLGSRKKIQRHGSFVSLSARSDSDGNRKNLKNNSAKGGQCSLYLGSSTKFINTRSYKLLDSRSCWEATLQRVKAP